ncbi:MAG: beta-galactosidase [Clostridia bacterium]|nr:beta-galactosidase [Clostridia bacterium]
MKKPFMGCAYYPEDWAEEQIDYDISMMKKAGITCARIGEFAWRKMEPERGRYDFKWLHDVVDRLGEAGISVVMGTPTATPPIWLIREYPDVAVLNESGIRKNHGGRRHCCSNNPRYIEACDSIVHAMGREFGKDKNIIGWQIDNEIYLQGCVCGYCINRFRNMLKAKYKTVDELNRQWNLNLFSQAYDSFEDIPPAVNAWHNPHILLEWRKSQCDAHIDFIHRQADILRQYTTAPIGTDMMPVNGVDYEKMNEKLDVVMFNHYNVPSNLHQLNFWFNYLRTLRDRPFWNTETAPTWNGSTAIGQYLKPEGFCRVNSWLPVALGGEANMYWLWRQHWAGHELMHGSVLSPEGRPTHTFGEIQQTCEEFERASDFIMSTMVDTNVALHYTSLNYNMLEIQPLVADNPYTHSVMRTERALVSAGVCHDVIGARADLCKYKLLFSPYMLTLEDGDLSERIEQWVKNGGVWVAGPMTDQRNSIGAHYTDRAMGILERMTGVRLEYGIPTDGCYLKAHWSDGSELCHEKWVECYSAGGETLAEVTKGHSALVGKSVISKFNYGSGKIILCGTVLDVKDCVRLVNTALEEAGITAYKTEGMLTVVPRVGDDMSGLVLCECGYENAAVELPYPMTDVLSGRHFEAGKMQVEPYGVYVLVK